MKTHNKGKRQLSPKSSAVNMPLVRCSDYVFGSTAVKVTDQQQFRAAGVMMDGGVDAEAPGYLATYTLRASADAAGTFQVNVKTGDSSLLRDSGALAIPFRPGRGFEVNVGKIRQHKGVGRE